MTPTQRLLTAARDYIAEKPEHWQQHEFGWFGGGHERAEKFDGAVCMVGAVNLCAARQMVAATSIRYYARATLGEVVDCPTAALFNDAPGRTREEVIAAFDRAIELAAFDRAIELAA